MSESHEAGEGHHVEIAACYHRPGITVTQIFKKGKWWVRRANISSEKSENCTNKLVMTNGRMEKDSE